VHGQQNLKKQYKLPPIFSAPDNFQKEFEVKMNGYRFFVNKHYERNKEKPNECRHRDKKSRNIIAFQIQDEQPIDFLDKMGDKEKDLKLLCEQTVRDFLKNQDTEAQEKKRE